ncbi:MAG: Rid family detoxifying hydrolase [Pseudomonadota bacterium]
MMSRLLLLLPVLLLTGCVINVSANEDDEPDYLISSSREDNGAPYSDAVRAGDTLYLSGKLGIDPQTGELADGGIQAETLRALQNISRTLDDFDSSMDELVKCTVFLADVAEWGEMNDVYRTFFRNPPARSAVGVGGLPLGARVEIECIAYVGY